MATYRDDRTRSPYTGGPADNIKRDQPPSYRGRGPKNYQRSDERIREDVNDRLTAHPHLDATEIEVSVSGGEVTLEGTVLSRDDRRIAEDVADSVTGVRDVHNRLRISRHIESLMSGDIPPSEQRSRSATT